MEIAKIAGLYRKSPISPISGLKIADFRRLAIFRQGQIAIAKHRSKIADLAIYCQKWQHCVLSHLKYAIHTDFLNILPL